MKNKPINNKKLFFTGLALFLIGRTIFYLVGGLIGESVAVAFDLVSLPMLAIAIMRYFVKLFSKDEGSNEDQKELNEKIKNEEARQKHVENKKNKIFVLKKKKKYTTIASILIFLSSVLTIFFVFFFGISKLALVGVLVYLFLAYFVYREKKWAIVAVAIFFTLDKILQGIEEPNMAKSIFFWWIAFMSVFLGAYRELSKEKKIINNKISQERKEDRRRGNGNRNNSKPLLLSLFGIVILISGVIFYWFAVRPANIRKACSLVEIKTYSQEEKDDAKKYLQESCPNFESLAGRVILRNEGSQECLNKLDILYAPTGNENQTRSATDEEYKECLRRSGLQTE